MAVYRLLVTASAEDLILFHFRCAALLLFQEKRGDTALFTAMEDGRDLAIKVAQEIGITLQEIVFDKEDNETYPMLVDNGPGWRTYG